jgi:hypothetical protein
MMLASEKSVNPPGSLCDKIARRLDSFLFFCGANDFFKDSTKFYGIWKF